MLKDILELLDSIGDQTYHHTESILVIERSTELFDRIKQYAEEKAIPNLKVVFNHEGKVEEAATAVLDAIGL